MSYFPQKIVWLASIFGSDLSTTLPSDFRRGYSTRVAGEEYRRLAYQLANQWHIRERIAIEYQKLPKPN